MKIKKLFVIKTDDLFEECTDQRIYVFSNVENNEDEFFSLLESNVKFNELKNISKNMDCNIEMFLLKDIIQFYIENKN